MTAFRHAVRLGVDVLELDLGLSRDGVLVVTHDPEVNETLCSGGERLPGELVRDLTFAQLQTLDCGRNRNPLFPQQVPVPGERMPRLEQVLELLESHLRLKANIEIKTFVDHPQWTWPPERFASSIVQVLADRDLATRVVVQSFDPAALKAVARLDPSIPLAALVSRREEMEPMLTATGARILSPRHSELTRADVVAYHKLGIRVIPWTVNDKRRMRQLIQWGVDGIITDFPDRLMETLH
jgi:glycerophosphoryl diester phosphodiesterase